MTNTTAQTEPACLEITLVHRAQAGDNDAFDQLARRYRPLLFALAFLRTSHTEEAEDLVQDVLTKAWEKLPTLVDTALFLPWLKTVLANACNSWYRRARSRPASLDTDFALHPAGEQGLPLQTLLAQDRQREWQQALLTLPEANRLALLMHIWGHASYEDIAAFTGVSVSTVDGRIYRARRQLRRLLSDSGAVLLGERPRPCRPAPVHDEFSSQRSKRMPSTTSAPAANEWEQPLGLALFTRRFSLMLDAGLSLARTFEIMETLPASYGEAAGQLRSKVELGEVLSKSMSERSDLFPPVYVGMIRAGEVGGILDEILQRLKKVLSREWALAHRHPSDESLLFLLPVGKSLPAAWEALSACIPPDIHSSGDVIHGVETSHTFTTTEMRPST